jgi:drug/metabolite transporter (DMT)-like permease
VPSTLGVWLAVVGSGVFTFVGQLLLTKGFQLEKAGIASVMRYLDVVCVFMWDYLLLGEKINYWSVVGAAIICSCATVIALRKAHTS